MRIDKVVACVCLLLSASYAWGQMDCSGVDGGTALPGTPCVDDNPYTAYAIWTDNCECQGYCVDWDLFIGPAGGPCDDNDPNTVNDVVNEFCECRGTPFAEDCLGGFMGSALPGTACDDGDPLTFPDVWSANCVCIGDTVGSNTVSGRVFLDLDGNGLLDGADLSVENRAITLTGANYTYTTFSGPGGQFSAQVWTDVYTLTVASGPWDVQAGVPPTANVMGAGLISAGHLLPLSPTSLQEDLSVAIAGARPPRPGFEDVLQLYVRNMGTVPVGGVLSLTFDPPQEHLASGSGTTVVGNTITWAIPELALGEAAYREVLLFTPLAVPLGTLVMHQATVQTAVPDADPGNDVAIITQEVVGSWDPNDKMVTPTTLTPQDVLDAKALQYTIRFQNTGTWYAEDVLITDTLPSGLDLSTFQFIGSSHPCTTTLTDGVLRFRFDNIMLPDSTSNEPDSHGFVLFRIQPLTHLLVGDSVDNQAYIYFDFNDPVVTNVATFRAEDLNTSVEGVGQGPHVRIWPVPVGDRLHIAPGPSARGTVRLAVIDMQGRTLMSTRRAAADLITLPLAELPSGMYVLQLELDGTARHLRFLKGTQE